MRHDAHGTSTANREDVSIGEITGPLVGAIASEGISRIGSQAFEEKFIDFLKDERGSLNLNFD